MEPTNDFDLDEALKCLVEIESAINARAKAERELAAAETRCRSFPKVIRKLGDDLQVLWHSRHLYAAENAESALCKNIMDRTKACCRALGAEGFGPLDHKEWHQIRL